MFEKVKALFGLGVPDEPNEEIYVPEDEEEAESFDPGYVPSEDNPLSVPGHPAVVPNG